MFKSWKLTTLLFCLSSTFIATASDLSEDGSRFKLTCSGRTIASDGQATEFELVATDAKNPYIVDGKICRSSRKIASTSTIHPTCASGRLEVDANHGTNVDRCYVNHLRTINPTCPGGAVITHQVGMDTCETSNFVYKQPGVIRPQKVVKYQYVYEDEAKSRKIASENDSLEEN